MDAPILRLTDFDPTPHGADPQVTLEITRGKVHERLRPVNGRVFLIGTAGDCDLVLGDLSFPEVYAYLFVEGTKISIRRLGAGPALYVCGDRTERADLFRGDQVQFGPFELKLLIDEAMPDACAAPQGDASGPAQHPISSQEPAVLRFSPPDPCAPWG